MHTGVVPKSHAVEAIEFDSFSLRFVAKVLFITVSHSINTNMKINERTFKMNRARRINPIGTPNRIG